MFICLDCGEVFEKPKEYVEDCGDGTIDDTFNLKYDGCPICGGAYDVACECDECGKYFPYEEAEDIYTDEKIIRLCKECSEKYDK